MPSPITIKDAAEKYHLPRHRFHQWLASGHLRRIGRMQGQGRGGIVLLDDQVVQALVTTPPKEGRPSTKTHRNSPHAATETT